MMCMDSTTTRSSIIRLRLCTTSGSSFSSCSNVSSRLFWGIRFPGLDSSKTKSSRCQPYAFDQAYPKDSFVACAGARDPVARQKAPASHC
jgi:hypothetical protein